MSENIAEKFRCEIRESIWDETFKLTLNIDRLFTWDDTINASWFSGQNSVFQFLSELDIPTKSA